MSLALNDIAAERLRQIEQEAWTPEHDDAHDKGELPRAAAAYALQASSVALKEAWFGSLAGQVRNAVVWIWPWDKTWWKPKDVRRMLVVAAALLVAEIERHDRAAARKMPAANHPYGDEHGQLSGTNRSYEDMLP